MKILAFILDPNTVRALRSSLKLPVQQPEPLGNPPPETLECENSDPAGLA